MRAEDIKERLEKQPFQPFRIKLSDGQSFDILHPELVMVFRHKILVGIPSREPRIVERAIDCSLLHITTVEEIASAA